MTAKAKGRDRGIERPRLPLRRPRTLLVEDEFKALRRRRDLLRMKDLDVISATSKKEALDRLRAIEFRVDVVLTDLNLTAGEGPKDAIDVAEAVLEHSNHSVPMYAYSGKVRDLPEASSDLFKDVVLKTASSRQVRKVFNDASEDAHAHFAGSVKQAEGLLAVLERGTGQVSNEDVDLIRDLIPGSVPHPKSELWIPERIGFLRLSEHGVGVPYGITHRPSDPSRSCAGVIGHDYLYGYGQDDDEAVDTLQDVVLGFAELIGERNNLSVSDLNVAVGASRRLMKLILGIIAREKEFEDRNAVQA